MSKSGWAFRFWREMREFPHQEGWKSIYYDGRRGVLVFEAKLCPGREFWFICVTDTLGECALL